MKTKLLIVFLLFSNYLIAQNTLSKKYDRATFTIVPFVTYLTDTIKRDTVYASWFSLPKESIFKAEIKTELVQTDLFVSDKFFYNHTTVPSLKTLNITKKDSSIFFSLYTNSKPIKLDSSSEISKKTSQQPNSEKFSLFKPKEESTANINKTKKEETKKDNNPKKDESKKFTLFNDKSNEDTKKTEKFSLFNDKPKTTNENSSAPLSKISLFNSQPNTREKIKDFDTVPDEYSDWIKKKLSESTIPGEMLFTWTNSDLLVKRSLENLIFTDKDRKTDAFSYEYYKKLLEKNYIIVQHSVKTKKYTTKPKNSTTQKLNPINNVSEKVKETTKVVDKTKSDAKPVDESQILSQFKNNLLKQKNEEKDGNNIDLGKLSFLKGSNLKYEGNQPIDEDGFSKAYVFRIVLDQNVLESLNQYPPKIPKNVNLEFIASTFSTSLNTNSRTEADVYRLAEEDGKMDFNRNLEKLRKAEYYQKAFLEALHTFEKGEFPCAIKEFNQLKIIDDSEAKKLDSLIAICAKQIKISPKRNQIAFKNATKLEQKQPNNFLYSTACNNYEYASKNKNHGLIQGPFNSTVEKLEMNLAEFKVLTTVAEAKRNRIKSKIDVSQGIFLDQQFKIVERTKKENGEIYDRNVGTAKVIKVSKNYNEKINDSTYKLTQLAQVDGGRVVPGMLLIENNNKGTSINAGLGYKYGHGAIMFGYEYRLGKIIKQVMPYPGLKVGVNVVANLARVNSQANGDNYTPVFFDLTFSRELYLHKKFDVKPYLGLAYGGQLLTKEGSDDGEQFIFGNLGAAMPINITGRYRKNKIKLMPDISVSLPLGTLNFAILTKIDF